MKKLLAIILIAVMLTLAFASCTGPQGPQGEKGEQGPQGEAGRSILKAEIIDGELWITYSDAPDKPINVGTVGGATGDYQNPQELDFYLLPDNTYGVMAGKAIYLESVTIPEKFNDRNVSTILDEAFKDSENLKTITIPDSVTNIGYKAFYNCQGLTSITIPDIVNSIGDSAFYSCTGLTSITIPDSVNSIGGFAFRGCTGLTSITISNSVTSIGANAFFGCSNLTSITFKGTKTQWFAITKKSSWNVQTGDYVVHCTDGDILKADDN